VARGGGRSLRVDEDAVEGPTGLWEDDLTTRIQKLSATGRWDDTNQTRGRRQTGPPHFAFPNFFSVVFPRWMKGRGGGRVTTHYFWLHHEI